VGTIVVVNRFIEDRGGGGGVKGAGGAELIVHHGGREGSHAYCLIFAKNVFNIPFPIECSVV
jgi:hypothetical protein